MVLAVSDLVALIIVCVGWFFAGAWANAACVYRQLCNRWPWQPEAPKGEPGKVILFPVARIRPKAPETE